MHLACIEAGLGKREHAIRAGGFVNGTKCVWGVCVSLPETKWGRWVCGGMGALAILGKAHLWKALHYMQTSVTEGNVPSTSLYCFFIFWSGRKVC